MIQHLMNTRKYSKAQILEFTAEQKKLISDAIAEIQKQIDSNRYKLPLNEELIFINTTAEDELGSLRIYAAKTKFIFQTH